VSDPSPLEWVFGSLASNPCNGCPPFPFIDARGGVTRGKKIRVIVSVAEMSRVSLSVRAHSSGVVLLGRGSRHVVGGVVHTGTLVAPSE
jgi:hypothetical protein